MKWLAEEEGQFSFQWSSYVVCPESLCPCTEQLWPRAKWMGGKVGLSLSCGQRITLVSSSRSGMMLGLDHGCCLGELTVQDQAWEGSARRQGHGGGSV